MPLIAHITDTHLDGEDGPEQRFQTVIAYLGGMTRQPDAIVFTGDIIQDHDRVSYNTVANALRGNVPVLYTPGNSDHRETFRQHLSPSPTSSDTLAASDPVNSSALIGDLGVITVDSSVPGAYYGELSDSTITWLRSTLSDWPDSTTVVLAMHHPPVTLGLPGVDALRLRNPDDLAAVIADYPSIAMTLVGHTHVPTVTSFADRPLIVAPGTASTLRLDWEPVPNGQSPLDASVPPALALHLIEDGRLTTMFRSIT